MADLKREFPQLLGLGIDEETALLVSGHEFEVIGANQVAVYDRSAPPTNGDAEFRTLRAGDRYDLTARRPIETGAV